MTTYYDNLIGGLAMNMVGPCLAAAAAERVRRGRRLLDPVRRGEHGDHRLQRRAQPRGRGRRPARLVPQAAPAVTARPTALLYLIVGLQLLHDCRQPRRRDPAGRGVRVRRRLELRLQDAVDGRAALQGPAAARVQGAVQHHVGGNVQLPLGLGH